jgi:hypothetical protein
MANFHESPLNFNPLLYGRTPGIIGRYPHRRPDHALPKEVTRRIWYFDGNAIEEFRCGAKSNWKAL